MVSARTDVRDCIEAVPQLNYVMRVKYLIMKGKEGHSVSWDQRGQKMGTRKVERITTMRHRGRPSFTKSTKR